MEIDNDYLRTGTAIGFRASREICSNYLSFAIETVKLAYLFSVYCLSAYTW